MKITGFRSYDWEDDGYYFHLDPSNTYVPSVEPVVIYRPGTWATFGIPQIGAMNIIGGFGYDPGSFAESLGPEGAFQRLFRILDISSPYPGEIRGFREAAGVPDIPIEFQGFLQLSNVSSQGGDVVTFRDASFVCTQPFFEGQGWISGGGTL